MAPSLSAEAPARRVRDIEYAAELLGLRLDVPWSIWDGYEAGVREPGILWRYDAEERTFTVRFENALDLNDLEDVSWAEVLDDVPMAESDGEPATLLQRLQSHAFGPRPLYLTRFRHTPVTSPAPRTPAPPYACSRSL